MTRNFPFFFGKINNDNNNKLEKKINKYKSARFVRIATSSSSFVFLYFSFKKKFSTINFAFVVVVVVVVGGGGGQLVFLECFGIFCLVPALPYFLAR